MRTSSKKAKGRRLQNWVREELLQRFSSLEEDDILCAIMGESGKDIKLSPKAQKILPYSIECKNKETFKGIYDIIKQASSNAKNHEVSLGIIKMNNHLPLALIDASYLFDLIKRSTP